MAPNIRPALPAPIYPAEARTIDTNTIRAFKGLHVHGPMHPSLELMEHTRKRTYHFLDSANDQQVHDPPTALQAIIDIFTLCKGQVRITEPAWVERPGPAPPKHKQHRRDDGTESDQEEEIPANQWNIIYRDTMPPLERLPPVKLYETLIARCQAADTNYLHASNPTAGQNARRRCPGRWSAHHNTTSTIRTSPGPEALRRCPGNGTG